MKGCVEQYSGPRCAPRLASDDDCAAFWTIRRGKGDRGSSVRFDPSTLAWLLPTSLLVLAIVSVPLLVLDERGLPRYRALRDEEAELEHQNEALRLEVRALARDVESLRSDESSVERIARDELGMVRPGEILFQFPE
jgi:cell division protein FtsB